MLVSGILESDSVIYIPGGSDGKESTCDAGDLDSVPGLGGSPRGGMTTHSSIPESYILDTLIIFCDKPLNFCTHFL